MACVEGGQTFFLSIFFFLFFVRLVGSRVVPPVSQRAGARLFLDRNDSKNNARGYIAALENCIAGRSDFHAQKLSIN
jgi:hypothetical protein